MVELGERKGRQQFVAARALFLRDGDCGSKGLLGGCGIGGIALEQDVAAQTMQEGVRKMLDRHRELSSKRFVDRRQRALSAHRPQLQAPRASRETRRDGSSALTGEARERLSEVVRAAPRVIQPTLRPSLSNTPEDAT